MPVSKVKSSKVAVSTAKKVSKPAVKTVSASVKKIKVASSLSLPVFGMDGSKKGTIALPKEIFGVKLNTNLIAQALRVYMINQRQGNASTKSRGEVRASTRKIYRQKGTGRARHGAITAPIFVGGGIAFGPKPRNFELKLSKQMKRKALFSAISDKLAQEKIVVVDTEAATGKTKEVYNTLKALSLMKKENSKVLFVMDTKSKVAQASRNIDGLIVEAAQGLNTYEVVNSNCVVLSKDSIAALEKVFLKGDAA